MMRRDRKRAPQFTEAEKQLIVCCILKEPDTENRKLDGETNRLKKSAWVRVTKEFNRHTVGCERDMEGLKKCWANMKGKLKKASDVNVDTTEGGILSMLQSSSDLIVTMENSSDGEQESAEYSQESEKANFEETDALKIECHDLERSASPSEHSNHSERSEGFPKSPQPEKKSEFKRNRLRTQSLLARVAQERFKYIKWKRMQKAKLFELKMKTQQALLDEAIAKRDLARKEALEQKQSVDTSVLISNGTL